MLEKYIFVGKPLLHFVYHSYYLLFTNVSSIGKKNPDFFHNFPIISLAKKKTKMLKSAITHLKWQIMI